MYKPDIKSAYKAVKKSTIKHSPEILTGIGIAGMVTTTVMAVKKIENSKSFKKYGIPINYLKLDRFTYLHNTHTKSNCCSY